MKGRTLEEAQAQLLAMGKSTAEVDAPRAAPGLHRQPAVDHARLPPARPLHARPADRALRAPRLRRGGDLGHQRLRPVGRRTRQGTGDRPAARGGRQDAVPRDWMPRRQVLRSISGHSPDQAPMNCMTAARWASSRCRPCLVRRSRMSSAVMRPFGRAQIVDLAIRTARRRNAGRDPVRDLAPLISFSARVP